MELFSRTAMVKDSSQYSPVDTVDDDDAGSSGVDPRSKSRIWPWLSHGALISASILFFTLWMGTPPAHLCGGIPVYSPANVAVEPVVMVFNGTTDFPSIYRGPPSPEIDATWDRVSSDVGPMRMTLEEMQKAGESASLSKVRYPDKIGGGFMVSLESAHVLHCLNLLRKVTWFEYYGPIEPSFQNAPEIVRMHIDHCIETIRQNIMCNADVTMVTWNWVENHEHPYPNFNTRHQCRNFEKIIDWAVDHAIHIDKSEVTRFEDTVDIPVPF